jgi:hypothetical protein
VGEAHVKSRLAQCRLSLGNPPSDISPETRGIQALRRLGRWADGIYEMLCANCSPVYDPVTRVHSMAAGSSPIAWIKHLPPEWIRAIQLDAVTLSECLTEKEKEAQRQASEPRKSGRGKGRDERRRQAALLLVENPRMTKTEMALALECSRKTLERDPELMRYFDLASPRRGFVTNGGIDASN